jgi:hypothetical protein
MVTFVRVMFLLLILNEKYYSCYMFVMICFNYIEFPTSIKSMSYYVIELILITDSTSLWWSNWELLEVQ